MCTTGVNDTGGNIFPEIYIDHQCRWHRWQICRRYQRHRWKITTGINDTGGKFAGGIKDTSGKFPLLFPLRSILFLFSSRIPFLTFSLSFIVFPFFSFSLPLFPFHFLFSFFFQPFSSFHFHCFLSPASPLPNSRLVYIFPFPFAAVEQTPTSPWCMVPCSWLPCLWQTFVCHLALSYLVPATLPLSASGYPVSANLSLTTVPCTCYPVPCCTLKEYLISWSFGWRHLVCTVHPVHGYLVLATMFLTSLFLSTMSFNYLGPANPTLNIVTEAILLLARGLLSF
jgi:hypothetical protein